MSDHDLEARLNDEVRAKLEALAHKQISAGSYTWTTLDLVNEGLLRVIAGQRRAWNSQAHFDGYLVRCLQSAFVDYVRRRKTQRQGDGVRPVSIEHRVQYGQDPESPTYALPVLELEELLDGLDNERRSIILARIHFDETQQQIATRMEVSLKRVKSTCAFFTKRLEEHLGLAPS